MDSPASGHGPLWAIAAVSAGASAFLLWLIYLAPHGQGQGAWVAALPHLNASLNASSSLLMSAGIAAIKAGRRRLHRALMLGALSSSALFLLSYIAYHHFHGDTKYPVQDWTRPLYLGILITHVLLSVLVLPLLLTVVYFAGQEAFERHKALARWTFPLWLYVSVSGVAVYLFLRPYY